MSKMGRAVIRGLKDILADKPMKTAEYKVIGGKLVRKVSTKRPSDLVKKARKRKWG